MEYEIYIDSVFFSNFALNFLVLSLADMGFQITKGLKKRLLGSLLGAGMYCIFLIWPIPAVWVRVLLGSMISGICMIACTVYSWTAAGIKRRLEEMLMYSLILGGIMFGINRFLPFLNGFIGTLSLAIGSYEVIKQIKNKWNNQKTMWARAQLIDKGVIVLAKTLFDTGNGLMEPISGKPVCVVQRSTATKLWEDLDTKGFRAIPFHSISGRGILKGYPVEQIQVEYEGRQICLKDIYLAVKEEPLGSRGDYELIINPMIFMK